MDKDLKPIELEAVKKSYVNILSFFFGQEKIETRYVRCLLKWGFQVHFKPEDITLHSKEFDHVSYIPPTEKLHRLEAVYHLVYLINLDRVIDDVELEVASLYAQQLGFHETIVADLLKSIATADDDGGTHLTPRQEVQDFLKVHGL